MLLQDIKENGTFRIRHLKDNCYLENVIVIKDGQYRVIGSLTWVRFEDENEEDLLVDNAMCSEEWNSVEDEDINWVVSKINERGNTGQAQQSSDDVLVSTCGRI